MISPAILLGATAADLAWLEPISWAANVLIAIAAILALWQVRAAVRQAKCALEQNKISLDHSKLMAEQLEVLRADITVRSRREAIGAALEQCERYAKTISPALDKLADELGAHGYHPTGSCDPEFPFVQVSADHPFAKIWMTQPDLRRRVIHALNELESFAMYFASDLADESVAFAPTAQPFCNFCEHFRFFIGAFRRPENFRLYQNLVKLYGMWKPRIERALLDEQGKLLESKRQKLPAETKGTPLGTKL